MDNIVMSGVFIIFVLLASLMVLNMLIGMLCAVVTAVAAQEKEKVLVTYVKSKLMSVLEKLDEDKNGTISKDEFEQLVHVPEAVRALEDLGVDVPNLTSLADHLFEEDGADEGKKDQEKKEPSLREDGENVSADAEEEEDEGKSMTFAE